LELADDRDNPARTERLTMYALARPLLFSLDAERAHGLALAAIEAAYRCGLRPLVASTPKVLKTKVFGIEFPNPVGLAAGLDKNGEHIDALAALGFGFIEIGTTTPRPQEGNPKPRMFRLTRSQAVINRLGFNNDGAEAVAHRLRKWKSSGRWPRVPVGINLGKSRVTPLEDAPADYARSFCLLRDYGDYFAVNVSSPNTPGLRDLQQATQLRAILRAITAVNAEGKPVLVKISPDLTPAQLADVVVCGEEEGIAGWIATNTTIDHSSVPAAEDTEGGLSGPPLRAKSDAILRDLCARTSLPVIGVGGVSDTDSARAKTEAGARLVQLYTGFAYGGPALPRKSPRGLAAQKQ